jgi:hypothetical protein
MRQPFIKVWSKRGMSKVATTDANTDKRVAIYVSNIENGVSLAPQVQLCDASRREFVAYVQAIAVKV